LGEQNSDAHLVPDTQTGSRNWRAWASETHTAIIAASATIMVGLVTTTINAVVSFEEKKMEIEQRRFEEHEQERSIVLQQAMTASDSHDFLGRLIRAADLGLLPDPDGAYRRKARSLDTPPSARQQNVQSKSASAPAASSSEMPPADGSPQRQMGNLATNTSASAIVSQIHPLVNEGAAAAAGFIIPVSGKIIAGFGSLGSGMHNDGINIAAPAGTPVHAAGDGIVTYAGNELRGYGNLILVKHGNDYVTAYTHLQTISVARGERVDRGAVIGTVGDTGDVLQPQLHFEIRRAARPVDPRALSMR
jgi:murein DD-endopeptidase MepM/ murein hydrolase activator NlpD